MDSQLKLHQFEKRLFGSYTVRLEGNKDHLEKEKEKFIEDICWFIDNQNFQSDQERGRPRSNYYDILKALLIMAYNGMSYRRTQSDLFKMKSEGQLSNVPRRSTLNDYANDPTTIIMLTKLIQLTALCFAGNENTLIIDSTWLSTKMYGGGFRKVYDKENTKFEHTRKIHAGCLKNSKVIAYVKTTSGYVNDSPIFEEIVKAVVESGFRIDTVLADAGYSSKNNHIICKELGILNVRINFRSNAGSRGGGSDLWKDNLRMLRENRSEFQELYRFRPIIEGVFSSMKRKSRNYLRSKTEISRDVELLSKCLAYNFMIMGRYS